MAGTAATPPNRKTRRTCRRAPALQHDAGDAADQDDDEEEENREIPHRQTDGEGGMDGEFDAPGEDGEGGDAERQGGGGEQEGGDAAEHEVQRHRGAGAVGGEVVECVGH